MTTFHRSLNQAGTSWPKPAVVQDAVAEAMDSTTRSWATDYEAAHRRVARAFGVADPQRLLLTPGATSALSVGIGDLPWEPGDRVLVSGLEHHALHGPVTRLAARGVEVGVIPRDHQDGGPLDLAHLAAELRRGGVRLVAMTAACNVTGELLPVPEIVALAHEHRALCLIDGAQIAGWMPVDLGALGVDLFAFAGHKALQAPWGIGGLMVAPGVTMVSPAATCELPTDGAPANCAPMPGPCDVGSVDRLALAGLVAALDWLDAPPQADRLDQARARVEHLATALERRPGVTLHGVRDPARRLPTVAFTVAGRGTAEVAAAFAHAGLTVAGGLHCAPLAHETLRTAPDGVVRFSLGPLNDDEDVARAQEVVRGL